MIRRAVKQDIDALLPVYDSARTYMRANGNPDQWTPDYPGRSLLEGDVDREGLYVMEDEEGIYACFALFGGEDPTYLEIDGAWLYSTPYHTIHRIASNGRRSGVLREACAFASAIDPHLRVDTHEKNLPMQRAVAREGFIYCGIIHLPNGDPRLAYERITPPEGNKNGV